jgi:hypothetical protein
MCDKYVNTCNKNIPIHINDKKTFQNIHIIKIKVTAEIFSKMTPYHLLILKCKYY